MQDNDRHMVLIVDDEDKNLRLLGAILKNYGYAFETARSGAEALKKASEMSPDIILLDIMMPGMDGYEVCERLKSNGRTGNIPVVMVTALDDHDSRLRGLKAGASDFLSKPIDSSELMVRTENLMKVKEFEDFLKHHNNVLEDTVREKTAQIEETLKDLRYSHGQLREGYQDTIYRLTLVAEYKDEDTASHIKRVGEYCALMAKELGWSDAESEIIRYAAPMHDIGKVGIPSDILLKPARLNPEEFALIKTHTNIGKRILLDAVSDYLAMAELIALTHHERWDGNRYPSGLKGDEIPLSGRLMNIADQYDALRSRRPYKPSFEHEKVVKIITEGDGRTMPEHFDPEVLEAFVQLQDEFKDIYDKFAE